MTAPIESLEQQAFSAISRMILEGRLRPGDVAGEAGLGGVLGMSRTPVRGALRRLESEGLMVREGRFLRVGRLQLAEFEEIFLLRQEWEPRAAERAADVFAEGAAQMTGACGPDRAAQLADLAREIGQLMQDGPGDGLHQWDLDDRLHAGVASALENRGAAQVIASLRRRTCIFDHVQMPARFVPSCHEHLAILEAITRGDRAGAGAAMAHHLSNAREAVLNRLDDLLSGTDG